MVDYGQEQQANRFVCPNDRQLALRAKLNTGWSVKTASFGYSQKAPPISPLAAEEQEAIVQVIQRAEQLDISEQQRIGKLVEKLENMRRNALGKNSSQCLLCGDGFGLLGAQKINCMDCRRQACTKCSIDTLAGKGPRHVYQTQPKRSPFLVSLFYFTKKGKLKIKKVLVSSTTTKEHWLCMICAETREMWKKSGAWFYKSIPKYILPVDNSRLTRNKSVRASRRHKDDDSSSDDERKIWGRRKRMNSSTESAFDALDQDQPVYNNNITSFIYSRQTSSSESQVSREMDSLKTQVSSITLNETKSYEDSGTEGRGIDADISECSRRESVGIRSSSDWNWTDTRTEDRVSPSTSSVNSSILKLTVPLENLRTEQKGAALTTELTEWFDDLWSRGQILLGLCYNTKKRALVVTVVRCINLLPMDNNGLSDPFVKLQLKPDPNHKKHKTSIKWKNLNPVFNEEFAFETRPTELSTQSLYVTVYDKDYGKSNDYLGGLILGGTGSKGLRLKHWMDMIRYPDHRHEQWHNLTEDVLD
ncbi:uncharacterized protein LOC130891082 isoform X6 [Diorhabda carinulata]|uniref:uncharacterized protein LOC130891082 isoform X6 n=1 Tax=Diorhabda carinulata TaxID=1163345 RepID=UPI0025A21718|nr:uncharacterized protein LOC130891082 isoform X6 [Diorhabda carinulata]